MKANGRIKYSANKYIYLTTVENAPHRADKNSSSLSGVGATLTLTLSLSAPRTLSRLAVWLSANALASINVVALRQTRLVPGWVTVCGRVNHLGM